MCKLNEYLMEDGTLNDKKIIKDLDKLTEMFQNGELIEVSDILIDIANAIRDFSV